LRIRLAICRRYPAEYPSVRLLDDEGRPEVDLASDPERVFAEVAAVERVFQRTANVVL